MTEYCDICDERVEFRRVQHYDCAALWGCLKLSRLNLSHWKTSFEKTVLSAWASKLNMSLINKGWSPVGYGALLTFRALALRRSKLCESES